MNEGGREHLRGRFDLLVNLVRAELTARYKTTTLGVLWFVLNPLLTMLILVVVFQRFINLEIENYPLFVISALLPWTFFQMAIVHATSSFTRASGLVKRVHIPRTLIPLSAVIASLMHFLISLLVLFAFMAVSGAAFTRALVWLPVAIVLQLVFLSGASLLLSSLAVLYRDVEYALDPVMRVLFYLTPSFYPLSYVPAGWLTVYLMNPMAGIVEIYRESLVYGTVPSARVVGMAAVTSLAFLALGIIVFKRTERSFDDYL